VSADANRPGERVRKSYDTGGRNYMNIFYIIGVVVVVLVVLGYFGLR
jgi:predicted nucleic acid-binding Zn ribbon protein